MPLQTGELTIGDKVIDHFREKLYGKTVGTVVMPMGPYRIQVEWPDDRGTQIEKIDDLTLVEE
jgi:hypothetical protein